MTLPWMIRKVTGHSMLPILPPGTYVVGLVWHPAIKQGQVVIAELAGREKIKRVQEIKKAQVYLVDDHPAVVGQKPVADWVQLSAIKAVVAWPRTKLT